MTESYSPNLFLFQNYIQEVVKEGKKHIKTAPFDSVDPEALFNGEKSQFFDLYQTYFLSAMSHAKTREIACLNYEKLLRQALVDKERLPVSMISSVLTACANVGGSTSGSSSLGSASLNNNPQNQSLFIGNLVKSILLHTHQPTSELTVGLNYLLESTRKKYSQMYRTMLEEVYTGLLVRFRQPALWRLVNSYLNGLLDEVEGHFGEKDYVFATRQLDQETNKMDLPVYPESPGFGKFGRCFICRKQAEHYMKEEFVPICSISCKDRVKELLIECRSPEEFNVLGWIIDNMPAGDEIIYELLHRELQATIQYRTLSKTQLLQVLKGFSVHIESQNLAKSLLPSLAFIITRWQEMIPLHEVTGAMRENLEIYFKTYYIEVLTVGEELPIVKDQLDFIHFFNDVLRHESTLISIFNRYDSRFFQPNILGRMLNLLSQYARKYQVAVDGLHSIVKTLVRRYVQHENKQTSWPFAGECSKKRELKKAITLFNKKPLKGIKHFKKIFENVVEEIKSREDIKSKEEFTESNESPIKSYGEGMGSERLEVSEVEETSVFEDGSEKREEEAAVEEDEIKQSEEIQDNEPTQQVQQDVSPILIEVESTKLTSRNELHESEKERVWVTPFHIALFIRQFTEAKSFVPSDSRQPITLPLLSQTSVGEYFGLNDDQVREVSQAYLSTFEFQDYEIDDMMRIVLNSFSLPKETQMVDRIIGDIAKRLVGLYQLKNDTESYQYFYLLLMVQTTNHNPNVRETQRLKLDNFLKMCFSMIGRIPEKAEADYNSILEHPLNLRMRYSEDAFFMKKHLGNLDKETRELFGEGEQGSEAKYLLSYIWEYLVIGLVWPGNSKGLLQSVILLGKEGLAAEQRAFFQALRKEGPLQSSRDAVLRIGMEYGNQLHGDLWNTVISLIYKLQNENEFSSAVLDKLFTNSGKLNPYRLRDFLRALLEFSKSDIRHDTLYTRQLFVLRHINSLLEYNIPRFGELAQLVWSLLQDYFKDICLHPRKEVSMGAIDSLKQMVLKLLKLHEEAVPHEALMETFLHIFERSCLEMKDLIANVLLNLITADLRDGWESIYQILDILDTKDKQLVVRILGRLVGQIGLARLTNLPRLHAICIKELRICGEAGVVEQLLGKLWQLSQHINDASIWLETIRSIKDIFKISLNNDLLQVFIRMCNRCLSDEPRSIPDKDIFNEIVDLLMFLIDLKGSSSKVIGVLLTSLDSFKETNVDFVVKYLGGSYGFLSIFQHYLSSDVRLPFAIFMKTYFIDVLLPALREAVNAPQFEHFGLWCINQYYDNLPLELVNLKEKDKDFQKTLPNLLDKKDPSEREAETELIEFHLSNKQYRQKSILHLIFLDIIQQVYKYAGESPKVKEKVEESVIDSYDCAFRINKYILLRNFLWKNGFLTGKHLPGLHKQEHRTLAFILRDFPFAKIYPVLKTFLRHYLTMASLYAELKAEEHDSSKAERKKGAPRQNEEKEGRNHQIYITDAELWLNQAHRGACSGWTQLRWQLNAEGASNFQQSQLWQLVSTSLSTLSLKSLPPHVCKQTSDTLKVLYDLLI